jgi:octaprenyl-diphosphate synthase
MEVIKRKTATLFEAGTRLGAVLAQSPHEIENAAADFGLQLGIAFQLVDDALDYRADGEELGKNLGDDLAEGKPTLPVIRAMEAGTEQERNLLRAAIETGGRDRIDTVAEAIESTKAIEYTISVARRHAQSAKNSAGLLPESAQRTALEKMADFAVSRTY